MLHGKPGVRVLCREETYATLELKTSPVPLTSNILALP